MGSREKPDPALLMPPPRECFWQLYYAWWLQKAEESLVALRVPPEVLGSPPVPKGIDDPRESP